MKKTYIRPTMSAEQVEASQAMMDFSMDTTSTTTVSSGWTKEETGNGGSFDTGGMWDSQW